MKKFEEVKNLVASLEADADKFYNKGNGAAGTRIRKGMQDLKNLAQALRLEIQEAKNQEKSEAK
jgi:hypothetical protein